MRRTIIELYDTTARAYGMATLDDYARHAAYRQLDGAERRYNSETTGHTTGD
jgi:hypothetical protein